MAVAMLNIIIAIIGIIVTIFFVVGTHEAAHFLMARAFGIKVSRFSIGFGKTLLRWTGRSGTEYVLALIPLGGYVKMLDESDGKLSSEDLASTYEHQPYYKKCLVLLAGPMMNLFCALILYWLIFMIGITTIKPVIGSVTPNSIAAQSGFQANEEIVSLNKTATISWGDFILRLILHLGNPDKIEVGTISPTSKVVKIHSLDLSNWKLDGLSPDPLTSLGITPYFPKTQKWPPEMLKHIQYGPLGALYQAGRQIYEFTYFNFILVGKLLTGKLSLQSLGGPLTIFQTAGNALNVGFIAFIGFLAFLSVSVGVINFLPIPGLDGGHIFMQTIEFIIRRPIPPQVLNVAYRLGLFLILILIAISFVNDILRL